MKKIVSYMTILACVMVIGAGTAFAQKKKPAAAPAVEKPAGVFEAFYSGDSYVVATYQFAKDKVSVATEKDSFECTWKLAGTSLELFILVDGQPTTDVYEKWMWDAAAKQFKNESGDMILSKKAGGAPDKADKKDKKKKKKK